jgi:uncharacterized protein (TIGR02145 family)
MFVMKKTCLLFFALIAFHTAFSQNDYVEIAKSYHRKADYFNAVLNASESLKNYALMKKGTLNKIQDILTEDYRAFIAGSKRVLELRKRDSDSPDNEVRLQASRMYLDACQQIVDLQDKIKEIPPDALNSKDNGQFAVLSSLIDFKSELENAKKKFEDTKLGIAELHYLEGIELKLSTNSEDIILAYKEFEKARSFSPGYKNSDGEMEQLKLVIVANYLDRGKKLVMKNTVEDISSAIKYFDEGLTYSPRNAELVAAKGKATNSIVIAYLEKGKKLTLGNTVEVIDSAIKLFDEGLTYSPGNTDLIAAKANAMNALIGPYYDQVVNYLSPDKLNKTPLDNAYAALILIEKIKKIITYMVSYKNLYELEQTAKQVSLTPYRDERDGNTYITTKIGEQIWMAENMKYMGNNAKYITVADDKGAQRIEKGIGAFYTFKNALNNNLVEKSQGVCPTGWHVPSIDELLVMKKIVSENAKGWKLNDRKEPVLWENSLWYKMNFQQIQSAMVNYKNASDRAITSAGSQFISSTKITPRISNDTRIRFDYLQVRYDGWDNYKLTLGTQDYLTLGSDLRDGISVEDVNSDLWYTCRCIKNNLSPTK